MKMHVRVIIGLLCVLNDVSLLRGEQSSPERRHLIEGREWKSVYTMGQAVTQEETETQVGEVTCPWSPENQCPWIPYLPG